MAELRDAADRFWATTQAVYDHERRQWLPTDPDGYVPDGRHMSEVK